MIELVTILIILAGAQGEEAALREADTGEQTVKALGELILNASRPCKPGL